ncbi:MAG: amino acid adenylation domain-containing protein [Candidatus Omnitrophota bacterium]
MGKLNKTNIAKILSLTPMQEGMLFHYLKNQKDKIYFEQLSLRISGEIKADLVEKAWNRVIEANEMLRTVFRWEKLDQPTQIILKEHQLILRYNDISEIEPEEKENFLRELKEDDRNIPFDLIDVPFRVALVKIDACQYDMVVSNHHILYDGWSNGILLTEFFNAYHGLNEGRTVIPEVKPSFQEFISWINNRDSHKQQQFWTDYLDGVDGSTELPIKKRKSDQLSRDIRKNSFILEGDIKHKLENVIRNKRITLASVFYAAWGLLLQRYCGNEDVIFGTTVSGRPSVIKGIEAMVGLFINTLPLRIQTHPQETLMDVVFGIDHALKIRADVEHTALADIQRFSGLGNGVSLFDTIVVIENYPLDNHLLPSSSKLSIDSYSMVEMTHYDLTVSVKLFDTIDVQLSYKKSVFDPESINHLCGHFKRIFYSLIENESQKVCQFEILSQEEKNRILYDFNNTVANYPKDKNLHELFEDQVEKTPDYLALIGTSVGALREAPLQMTYKQLNDRTNRLAAALIEKGVGPDTIVGIKIERSIEMIIGILGILKSGGAYLPIAVDYPQERIDYILKDSGAKLVCLTERTEDAEKGVMEVERLRSWEVKKVFFVELLILSPSELLNFSHVPSHPHTLPHPPVTSVRSVRNPSNIAYIIYTSGTTGKPKGVLVEHRNAVNVVNWFIDFHQIGPGTRMLQLSDYTFDASVNQIFGTLISGASLYIVSREVRSDIEKMRNYIALHAIHVINFVPTYLKELLCHSDKLESLHTVISGAEKLDDATKNILIGKGYRLVNQYGPTETTIDALARECSSEPVNLGKPIANARIYILDKYENVLPVGIIGELYVGGDGVSRGYLNRPELTWERFCLRRPGALFEKTAPGPRKNFWFGKGYDRVYKTGDWVRWTSEGNIEFLGRIDDQVKIRGYRIEVGEIENVILKYPGIHETVVLAKEKAEMNGDKDLYLCAYVVSNHDIPESGLKEYLERYLPDYMIPSSVVSIEKMPLTHTGKIDRKALPDPEIKISDGYAAPRNRMEEKLAKIWSDVLGVGKDKIGIYDNFLQLGGHSLKAVSLASRIHKFFNIKISLEEIFKRPTIGELYEYIGNATKSTYTRIETAEEKEYYPLSSAQKRLYLLHQMDQSGTAYHMDAAWILEGNIDEQQFEQSITALINRHESLRTSFDVIDHEPVQRIHERVDFEVNVLTEFTENTGGKSRFDLTKAPLMRVELIKIENNRHLLAMAIHHIISDGVSTEIIARDLTAFYSGQQLPELNIHYKDYAEWQNRERDGENLRKQGTYWKKQFEEEIPVPELPTDYPRPSIQCFKGSHIKFEISREKTRALNALALETGTTIYMVLLTLYTVWLSKITGQEDIAVGSPVAGRKHADLEKIIGMFVNTLVLRNYPSAEKTFLGFLREVKENTLNAFENQDYPYEALVEEVISNRDTGRNPLFDTMFALQHTAMSSFDLPGLTFHRYDYENHTSKFDLTLIGVETKDQLLFTVEYSTKLFKEQTIERFIAYFKNIIDEAIENKNRQISGFEIIPKEEKRRILFEFNDTASDYPRDKTIHQLFDEQVWRVPDHLAFVGTSVGALREAPLKNSDRAIHESPLQISYRELNHRSDQLADEFIQRGIRTGTIVGIMFGRSLEMIIGILGILKSGGAYLPIDPDYPQERIAYVLTDSGASFLVTTRNEDSEKAKYWNGEIYCLEYMEVKANKAQGASADEKLYDNLNRKSDFAYVIYTSGTTGKPKGVLVRHSNICPLLHWGNAHLGLNADDRLVQNLPYYFDGSIWEIFMALTSGASLYTVSNALIVDGARYADYMNRYGITALLITPTHFQALAHSGKQLPTLRHLCIGAEKLTLDLVERSMEMVDRQCRIYNMYGPTEATIMVAVLEIDRSNLQSYRQLSSVPIGKPLGNNALFILDKHLNLCPLNVSGELFVGGDGVSPGYLNNPELTSEKFTSVSSVTSVANKLYKTGDLCRWLSDGTIEFLGRLDDQVKIRGFRIELGEIEAQLLTHAAIKEAVVIARENRGGDKYLSAYVVSDIRFPESILREYLSNRLPEYMIPPYFISLESIPLAPNGKLNRHALPEPELSDNNHYTAPRNELEKRLVELWGDVLVQSSDTIGIDDNFFQLGGHSLKAMVLSSKVHHAFNVRVPLEEIFKNSTIRGISDFIREAKRETFISINPVEKKEYYPLSSAQKRLYLLQQMDETGVSYNIPAFFVVEGKVDPIKLEQTFKRLIARHESFRTSFHLVEDQPVQRIQDDVEFKISCLATEDTELTEKNNNITKKEPKTKVFGSPETFFQKGFWPPEAMINPFDLTRAPLIHVGLMRIEEEKTLLSLDMHHIISDGASMKVLIRDFKGVYQGEALPDLKIQYKDFSEWQNRETGNESMTWQEDYWVNEFQGDIPVLDLPIDFSRPSIQRFEGRSIRFELDKPNTERLKDVALENGATLYMTLLAIYNIFLSKLSTQEDIVIGSPVVGRRHVDLEKIIGMFVNTLALRNYPSQEKRFLDFLEEVKENALKAFENQDYPYETLVEQVVLNRDTGRNPLFDTMFVLQNTGFPSLELPDLRLYPHEYENRTSKFDLTLTGVEENDQLVFTFEYSTQLFREETIERFIAYFKNVITDAIENKNRRISDFEIITEEEKRRIIFEFNDTAVDYPKDKTLHALFDEQVKRTPDHLALIGPAFVGADPRVCPQLSYKELSIQSERMADELIQKGVQPDTIVGIKIERSIEMIIGIFGILKSGGAYLPIDSGYPKDRIDYILKDSSARLVIDETFVGADPCVCPCTSFLSATGNRQPATSLAYIIYTSGSTGKPKGVAVDHHSVMNRLNWMQRAYPIDEKDRILHKTPIVFDVSVWELFWWSFQGASLCLLEPGGEKDPEIITRAICRESVTTLHFVPSMLTAFLNFIEYSEAGNSVSELTSIRYLFSSGEALSVHHVEQFNRLLRAGNRTRLINLYGPTEATVDVSFFNCDNFDSNENRSLASVPIGKPIDNIRLYILDQGGNLQPVGVTGELGIAGVGLARGYLNRPELTAEKFIGCRLYKTGDLGRWLDDGNIEFLGRIDHQVKIRGFRIELGEIETILRRYDGIKDAIVLAQADQNGETNCCAYIVPVQHQGATPDIDEIRDYLSRLLPEYMIPAYFVPIDAIPLTINGKLDRTALPVPDKNKIGEGMFIAPRTQAEDELTVIWNDILGLSAIGIDDNFFRLGGHSIKAAALTARIHRQLQVKITLAEIFRNPTIRQLAQCIEGKKKEQFFSITPAAPKPYYAMSAAQKRIFITHWMNPSGTQFNMPHVFILEGEPDMSAIEQAFIRMIRRHETLRTGFEMRDNQPVQVIHPQVEFKIETCSADASPQAIAEKFTRPFDLSHPPLIRIGAATIDLHKYLLILDMHHIISDGVSIGMIEDEFTALYAGEERPPLKIQYKDFSEWQNRLFAGTEIQKQKDYWLKEFSEDVPALDLPVDYPRSPSNSTSGDTVYFQIENELTLKIKQLNVETETTPYMVLLAVLYLLLYRYSGQRDIVVGSVTAGRRHSDLDRIIGVFVNMLPIRNQIDEDISFGEFLEQVKIKALRAYENQDFQYDELVNLLGIKARYGKSPLFDVHFTFQNAADVAGKKKTERNLGFVLSQYRYRAVSLHWELGLAAIETNDTISFTLDYLTALFKKTTVENIGNHFVEILETCIRNKEIKINEIGISFDLAQGKIDISHEEVSDFDF